MKKTKVEVLKELCKKITGTESKGETIAETLQDIVDNYQEVADHEHQFETTIVQKYKVADKCCKKKKTCTICGYEEEYDALEHEHVTVTESNMFEETYVCADCGYTGTRSKM